MATSAASINWEIPENYFSLNPRLPQASKKSITDRILEYFLSHPQKGIIAVQTSGTTGEGKTVIHSKRAFLAAAAAVNKKLGATVDDRWLRALPLFHVGGLSIEARAHLSGSKVIVAPEIWDPEIFVQLLKNENIQWASLVPTQLFDVVEKNLRPANSLKAIILGGGFTSQSIIAKARALGWPLMWSYGMTETAAMVSLSDEQKIEPLPHVSLKSNADGFLMVRSPSLFDGYLNDCGILIDQKKDGWWTTSDKVENLNGEFKLLGRGEDYIKISGEGIYLQELQGELEQTFFRGSEKKYEALVWPSEDSRRGTKLVGVFSEAFNENQIRTTLSEYNRNVLPVFKISEWVNIPSIPRNDMGKIDRQMVKTFIQGAKIYSIA